MRRYRNGRDKRAPAPLKACPWCGTEFTPSSFDDILDAWIETADEQVASGNAFAYARKKSPHRLLHMPLEPEIGNLAEPHRRFVAGRSMRDVEPNVALKVRDPYGNAIANAEDLT
ncbi:MAG: hypothetical protein WBW81_04125 [Methylocella sp.]